MRPVPALHSDVVAEAAASVGAVRARFRVRGAVQGVGMRPFVHGLARRFGLSGFVLNDGDGVLIEVEGPSVETVEAFAAALAAEPPPLARFETIERAPLAPLGETGFRIVDSRAGRVTTRVPPDAATCTACLDDLFDPASRFHHYPFVNCTHCGPRWTITRRLPYDRPQTAMAGFPMCAACASDYRDPENRRFHAEPIACPACGPRLDLQVEANAEGSLDLQVEANAKGCLDLQGEANSDTVIETIVAALRAGRIVALKGIGGFHLMCDARNETAVAELRRRKNRDAKPFAVMVENLASAEALVRFAAVERALFCAPAAPIVLADVAAGPVPLAPSVAPRLVRLGVMRAHAPLHHLIFRAAAGGGESPAARAAPNDFVVVATSANPGGEPLVIDDADARRHLAGIADLIVGHDRPIVIRSDDSVVQAIAGAPSVLRRAKGYVPEPIDLGADGPAVLATGAHLKATLTVTRGREAFVSNHVGDLDTAETVRFYRETAAHLLDLLDVAPEIVACDLHPDYRSSLFARDQAAPVLPVQHHAAHVAALAAEHRIAGPLLGLALDGTGLGDDGTAWGGELIRLDGTAWTRLGHLAPLALPGGDRAARESWRMGLSALHAVGELDRLGSFFADEPSATLLAARLRAGREPTTTSLGRLFDAVAALLGLRRRQDHEAQAAMELEALVAAPVRGAGLYALDAGRLDFAPLLRELIRTRPDPRVGAELFHGTLIDGFAALVAAHAGPGETIALGGGCLMNRVLAEGLAGALGEAGLRPRLARCVPPGDGGLSLGQAAIARAFLASPSSPSPAIDIPRQETAPCASPFPRS